MKSIILMMFFLFNLANASMNNPNADVPVSIVTHEPKIVLDTLYVYNPVPGQTDDSPHYTADGTHIDTAILHEGKLRYMAMSEDMIRSYNKNARISYGDTVELQSNDADINGIWIVHDTMNKRYSRTGDLLFHSKNRRLGKWYNVRIKNITKSNKRFV